VTIERYNDDTPAQEDDESDSDDASDDEPELLKVTVTDNGCGMESIQSCVNAFHTSKGQHSEDSSSTQDSVEESQTAGRYGIGLTLCLLHAQRLVPDSIASIRSATTHNSQWTHTMCVVDTDNDSVRCIRKEGCPKQRPNESGTSVSVLVPVS
jgi:DNA topoisomerase VI subunit B